MLGLSTDSHLHLTWLCWSMSGYYHEAVRWTWPCPGFCVLSTVLFVKIWLEKLPFSRSWEWRLSTYTLQTVSPTLIIYSGKGRRGRTLTVTPVEAFLLQERINPHYLGNWQCNPCLPGRSVKMNKRVIERSTWTGNRLWLFSMERSVFPKRKGEVISNNYLMNKTWWDVTWRTTQYAKLIHCFFGLFFTF